MFRIQNFIFIPWKFLQMWKLLCNVLKFSGGGNAPILPGYAPALRRKCRSRQFLGAQSILYCTQIFLNFPEKHSCGKHSPYKFYLSVSTIYFSQPSCHRLEKKTPYLKLFLNTQMKKYRMLGCAWTLSKTGWLSILEYLPHNSEVWRLIHIPAVVVSKEPPT